MTRSNITCTDFQMEKLNDEQTQKLAEQASVSQTAAKNRKLPEAEHTGSRVKKFKPIKVATPGSFVGQMSDNSEDEET